MTVLIGGLRTERAIDHYEERTWRTWKGEIIEQIPVPLLFAGERLKQIPGGYQILRKGEF